MESGREQLGRIVAQDLGHGPSVQRIAEQRARLVSYGRTRTPRWFPPLARLRFPLRWSALGAVAVTLGALIASQVVLSRRTKARELLVSRCYPEAMACSASSATVAGAWVSAEQGKSVHLAFSEGSRVEVQAGARARLGELSGTAAEMTLESGKLVAAITPKQGIAWTFAAGPYQVHVLGTRLSLDWNSGNKELLVEVSEGKVRVSGASLAEEGINVVAGQQLSASYESAAAKVGPIALSTSASTSPISTVAEVTAPAIVSSVSAAPDTAAVPSISAAPGTLRSATAASRLVATAPARDDSAAVRSEARAAGAVSHFKADIASAEAEQLRVPSRLDRNANWKALAQAAQYDAAMAAARRVGFRAILDHASASDLMLLADAARLSVQVTEATLALRAIRDRFRGQEAAELAAFRLGRLAVDAQRDHAAAVRWFRIFLQESGGKGGLAEAARGRLMSALVRLGDREGASAAAEEYLRYHPQGQNATKARSLLVSPSAE